MPLLTGVHPSESYESEGSTLYTTACDVSFDEVYNEVDIDGNNRNLLALPDRRITNATPRRSVKSRPVQTDPDVSGVPPSWMFEGQRMIEDLYIGLRNAISFFNTPSCGQGLDRSQGSDVDQLNRKNAPDYEDGPLKSQFIADVENPVHTEMDSQRQILHAEEFKKDLEHLIKLATKLRLFVSFFGKLPSDQNVQISHVLHAVASGPHIDLNISSEGHKDTIINKTTQGGSLHEENTCRNSVPKNKQFQIPEISITEFEMQRDFVLNKLVDHERKVLNNCPLRDSMMSEMVDSTEGHFDSRGNESSKAKGLNPAAQCNKQAIQDFPPFRFAATISNVKNRRHTFDGIVSTALKTDITDQTQRDSQACFAEAASNANIKKPPTDRNDYFQTGTDHAAETKIAGFSKTHHQVRFAAAESKWINKQNRLDRCDVIASGAHSVDNPALEEENIASKSRNVQQVKPKLTAEKGCQEGACKNFIHKNILAVKLASNRTGRSNVKNDTNAADVRRLMSKASSGSRRSPSPYHRRGRKLRSPSPYPRGGRNRSRSPSPYPRRGKQL